MLSTILSTVLTPAVGVMLSPFPIAGLILILLSKKPGTNSIAYFLGWFLGCSAAFWIALFLLNGIGGSDSDTKSALARLIYLVLGLLLVFFAIKEFLGRPKKGQIAKAPKWFASLQKIKPAAAAILAFLLSAINPKNLLLILAAGASIGALNLTAGQNINAWLIFTLVASIGIIIPILAFFIGGQKSKKILNELSGWLVQNNAVVLAVILFILGIDVLTKAF